MSLQLIHYLNDRVVAMWSGNPLFEYVYIDRGDPFDGSRPYFHPLYSLAGDLLTCYRPHDHTWHKGLSMTFTVVNDQNFWGGNTYRNGTYRALDNVGSTHHDHWHELRCDEQTAVLHHALTWVTQAGETWLEENRQITVTVMDGYWQMDWRMQFRNVSGQRLVFGSPTTEGRPNAGYTGLFWRGPRSFQGALAHAEDHPPRPGDELMGMRARWLAMTGQHDGSANWSTLIVTDHPENVGYPTKWFVRSSEFAAIAAAFTFDETHHLAPGETLNMVYNVMFVNGRASHPPHEGT